MGRGGQYISTPLFQPQCRHLTLPTPRCPRYLHRGYRSTGTPDVCRITTSCSMFGPTEERPLARESLSWRIGTLDKVKLYQASGAYWTGRCSVGARLSNSAILSSCCQCQASISVRRELWKESYRSGPSSRLIGCDSACTNSVLNDSSECTISLQTFSQSIESIEDPGADVGRLTPQHRCLLLKHPGDGGASCR